MVERKKTGLAKARKRVCESILLTLDLVLTHLFPIVHLGQAIVSYSYLSAIMILPITCCYNELQCALELYQASKSSKPNEKGVLKI